MKAIVVLFILMFVSSPSIYGQIKIGDNPQNIDPASVLELESTSKVLVITKVTTDQMNAISPPKGGLVFNTDANCIYYYNGTQWINLCNETSGANLGITNDPIVNNRTTIVITESAQSYNLEVAENSILGSNIVDGGIGPNDIQDNSITVDKLGENSVGSSELRQNSVGSIEIIDHSIQVSDLANSIADQVLSTNENGTPVWTDASVLKGIVTNTITISGSGSTDDPIRLSDAVQNDIDAKEILINKDPNILLGDSNDKYPTQNAVRTFVNNSINDIVVSGDGDAINEQNTNFEVANGNLEITDIDGTIAVPLSDIQRTDAEITALGYKKTDTQYTAGNGLALDANNNNELSVNVDDTTIEIVGDILEVKDGGISADKINIDVVGDGLNQDANGAIEFIRGNTDNQILKWDSATNTWGLDTDNGETYTAGNGLALDTNNNNELSVNVDDTTVEIVGDILEVKDGGISADKINIDVVGDGLNQDANGAIELIRGNTDNQILKWDSATNTWGLDTDNGETYTAGNGINISAANEISVNVATTSNLSNTNLTQNTNEDRLYDLNNQTLYFDGAGNVGIGQFDFDNLTPAIPNSAEDKLDVIGQIRARNGFAASRGTANEPSYGFYTNGDTDTGMYRPYADQLGLVTDGVEALRIGFNQNVGIGNFTPTGNTNPSSTLEVKGSFATNIRIDATNTVAILENDYTIIVQTGASNVTLPPAAGCQGRIYILKNITGGPLTIDDYVNSDGTNLISLNIGVTQLQSDGTNWQQIN